MTIYDLDCLAFYDKPILKFERALFSYFKFFPRSFRSFLAFMPKWIDQNLSVPYHVRTNLSTECPIYYANHHESHAASAYYPSPFDRSLIFTADGVGDWATTSWGIGEGTNVSIKQEIHFPHSLGLLYSTVTAFLGFHPNGGEGKVMALAAYGEPALREQFAKLVYVHSDGSYKLDMSYFSYAYGTEMFSENFVSLFGEPRTPESDLAERHYDIAATLQWVVEDALVKTVRHC